MSVRHPKKPKINENGKQNTRPIIWTAAFIEKELNSMLKMTESDPRILFIGELFAPKKYTRARFSEWAKKFKENKQISDAIDKIEEILETRCAKGALNESLSASFTKFHLINNHDWDDKSEVINRHKGLPNLSKLLAATARKDKDE